MTTILITGIGGDIAQGVATIIRESLPETRLIGVDIHDQHGGINFVDDYFLIPPANSPEYLDRLRESIVSKGVDIIVPMPEAELGVIMPLFKELGQTRCIIAGETVVTTGIDKLATIEKLQSLGVETPWTISSSDGSPKEYPCIFKSRLGSGSRTVFTVTNQDEAKFLSQKYPEAIFQEYLHPADQEITCAVYRRRDGEVASLLMLRRLTGGLTGWAKVIENNESSDMCRDIANGLDLQGSMNIQLRLTESGPRVFEINPRFSSTSLMRHRIGFSDVLWSLEEARGNDIEFPIIQPGICMARTQDAIVLN